jgi:nucleoside 2-deoxyribosyltransferase
MGMRLYLAGPMRGKKHYNRAAFRRWAGKLRNMGFETVTPIYVDLLVAPWFDHTRDVASVRLTRRFQRACLKEIEKCDGVALLPGWEKSEGTGRELKWANMRGLVCCKVQWWLEIGGFRFRGVGR